MLDSLPQLMADALHGAGVALLLSLGGAVLVCGLAALFADR